MARYALVVGIETYHDLYLGRLNNSIADAQGIANLLKKHGQCPQNQTRILSGTVTGQECFDTLKEFLQLAEQEEAIIYFSGHGVIDSRWDDVEEKYISQGYLAASNCKIEKKEKQTIVKNGEFTNQNRGAIALQTIVRLINKANLNSLIIILDTCHSELLIEEVEASFGCIQKIKTCYFLASCQSFESSWSKESKTYSEFTGFFLEALDQKYVDKNNTITVAKAFEIAAQSLENSGNHKNNKGRQKPTIFHKGNIFPLVTYPLTSLFRETTSKFPQITDDDLRILQPYLEPIYRPILTWAMMEGISAYALNSWLALDESLSIESFFTVVQEQFPKKPDGSLSIISVLQVLSHHPRIALETREQLKEWLQAHGFPDEPNIQIERELNPCCGQTRTSP